MSKSILDMINEVGQDRVHALLKALCEDESKAAEQPQSGAEAVEVELTFPIMKYWDDDEKKEEQLVTGVVLEPNIVDAHGDYERPTAIKDAAHKFLSKYNRHTMMGIQHQLFGQVGIDLVESWIAPQDFKMNKQLIRKGSWVMTAKIHNETLWQKVKSGAITGFSIGGQALVKPE